MYFILDSLLGLNFKKAFTYLLLYVVGVVIAIALEKCLNYFDIVHQQSTSFIYFHFPSILVSWILLFSTKTFKYTKEDLSAVPLEEEEDGNFTFLIPIRMFKYGYASYWIEAVRDFKHAVSMIIAFLISPLYLFFLLWLYIQGFSYFSHSFISSWGIITFILISIQGKIIFLNHGNAGLVGGKLSWYRRIRLRKMNEIMLSIDLLFITLVSIFIFLQQQQIVKVLLFVYGFRIMRVLLLIPYFEQVWESITRGLRLTTNYVSSFLVILMVFSMNSRMLFGESSDNFKTLASSVYNNFQIILGNGFDINSDSNQIASYVFFVTLLLGIIFTSVITALITDSILSKKMSPKDSSDEIKLAWYKRDEGEEKIFYSMRVVLHVISI